MQLNNCNNWHCSRETAVQTVKFIFSSEHAVTHWFVIQTLHRFSPMVKTFQWWISAAYSSLGICTVFRMSTSSSNTRSKFAVLRNDTIALISMSTCCKSFHIINKTVFQLGTVDQLWQVSLTAFQRCIPLLIMHWHINLVHSVNFTSEYQFNYLFT